MTDYDYLFKYIVIGDSGVGKSCLLLRFMDDKFNEKHDTTIGMEFVSKCLKIKNKQIKLQIWDTVIKCLGLSDSVNRQDKSIFVLSLVHTTKGAFVVFDITRRETFENVSKWLDDTRQYANTNMFIVLLGNKTDLESQREVSSQEAAEFAAKNKIVYMETSAKTASNVKEVFDKSAEEILKKIDRQEIDPYSDASGIKVGNDGPRAKNTMMLQNNAEKKKSKGCC